MAKDLAPPIAAPQQSRGPRPLPLFLSLVAQVAERDPALARAALRGVRRYQDAPAPAARPERPLVAQVRGAGLRDCGGEGRTILLVPSVINPPSILDLDPERSLAGALARRHRVLLLDWGPAAERAGLDLGQHVEQLLLPLIEMVGEVVLAGYCLGGTMSLLAARECRRVEAVVTLAAPWHFTAYPGPARSRFNELWQTNRELAERFGGLPMEVLQMAFWSLDPDRIVGKFARFGSLDPQSDEARRFVTMEEWANGGEPLPCPAARELVEDLFLADQPGLGRWHGGGLPRCPMLHVAASGDRLVPASSTAPGQRLDCPAGHVGMIVGSEAPRLLHGPLLSWLDGLGQGR